MKTENLYIECESLEQRNNVINLAIDFGLANRSHIHSNRVRIINGGVFAIDWKPDNDATKLTYSQFMEKYAMQKFKEAVAKAKDKFNVDNTGLSRMLGYHRDYINEALKDGRSTKWQEKTIAKIEALSKGIVLDKITVEIDAKVSPEFKNIIDNTKAEIEKVVKENTQLKKDKEQLVVHNGKLSDDLNYSKLKMASLATQLNNKVDECSRFINEKQKACSENKLLKEKHAEKVRDLRKELDYVYGCSKSQGSVVSGLKGQIRSLEKINAQYKNKYAASVTIGLMIASVLICVILWGGF